MELNVPLLTTFRFALALKATQVIRLPVVNLNHHHHQYLSKPTLAIHHHVELTPNAITEYAPVYLNTKEIRIRVVDRNAFSTLIVLVT